MSLECWIFPHFIWSHLIAASLGNCSLHPTVTAVCVIPSHIIISTHLNSSELIRCLLGFFHLISSNPISCLRSSLLFSALLSWSQLFSLLLMSPELFSSLLISSRLISAFLRFSQLVSTLLRSPVSSFCAFSSLLFSPPLTSSRLFSAHSQTISPFSRPKPAPKTDLDAKASNPYAFHREDFTQNTFTHSKFLEKLGRTEAFTQSWGNFSPQQSYHTQPAFTQRIFYTQNLLHTANIYTQQTCTHSQLLHRKSSGTQKLWHTEVFTQRSPNTEKP